MDATLYLVPDYEDSADADKVLGRVCEEIFCRELEGWYTDVDVSPKDRSLKVFKQWFDVHYHEVVEDVGRGPIENDEGPDERHRFSPRTSSGQATAEKETAKVTAASYPGPPSGPRTGTHTSPPRSLVAA